ncbi:hypothetical protein EI53_01866 [Fusobacterium naviforme]|nr:hypothetical protein F7P78_06915 [Fusobacterium naviforme]PSL09082.1 hypothetical protein EI53_01866 [Fusobacterium naviforme]STO27734.1 Uncharacterised protein [Fusobacterium naviforme]
MSKAIKITSMRCPDCGGSIEPADGKATARCPYCNAVLHIEGISDEGSGARKMPASLEKDLTNSGYKAGTQKFVALQWFDYIVLALTVIGMIWTMWTTGNGIFMIMVAVLGAFIVCIRIMIRGQMYRNKNRWQ